MSSQLTVERTFKLTGRPWLLVTGRLDGEPLNIGDQVTIADPGRPAVAGVVRSIELHSAPGTTTIAVDLELDDRIQPGTVLSRAE
ncbi:hypothetical protein HDA40_001425 [Hamadaea flava]|uniref:Lipoyl-binding domain-containing protein n=1 Tax=Hamadaea flava TaxID=1742688 RepID=A0ABV8LN79_9ACTN|nr:hypothetical protein [Hamadaea flava]MCP2322918.1 hypothetical protein [Hamadaea flava]